MAHLPLAWRFQAVLFGLHLLCALIILVGLLLGIPLNGHWAKSLAIPAQVSISILQFLVPYQILHALLYAWRKKSRAHIRFLILILLLIPLVIYGLPMLPIHHRDLDWVVLPIVLAVVLYYLRLSYQFHLMHPAESLSYDDLLDN